MDVCQAGFSGIVKDVCDDKRDGPYYCYYFVLIKRGASVINFADFAEIAGIEYLLIDDDTTISGLKKDIRINEIYYAFAKGFK